MAETAEHLDDAHRVEPADAADGVLAIGREDVVLRAGGVAGAHLRALLPDARNPERELPLALQVAGLDVEASDDDHLTVEVAQARVIELAEEGEIGGVCVVLDE